jgi:hypothetical protein
MAARFEHEPGPDPIELLQKMLPSFAHIGALQQGTAAGNNPNGIAAGMSIDTAEGVFGHDLSVRYS